jgi:hypothetical protein
MKKSRAKKLAMQKAVHARPKRKASRPDALPDVMPVERPANEEPPAPALKVVGDKARRRLDRPSGKRFAAGGGVIDKGSTPSLAEASEYGWTVDNYPPRDLLKHGKIR